MKALVALCLMLGLSLRARGESDRVRIVVMDIGAPGDMDRDLVAMVSAAIAAELDRLGPFDAITMQDVDRSLELQGLKEQLGCDDASQCLAEIGGALGAEYLLSGSVLGQGSAYFVQLKLSHSARAELEGLAEREYQGGPKGLLEEIRAATRFVVRGLLAERSGQLRIVVSEEGATLRVDDSIVGVSPMPTFTLAGGIHTVSAEREGFVREQRDVRIFADQLTREMLTLRPSVETWQRYRAQATLWRRISYGLLAFGGVASGGAVAAYVVGAEKTERYRARVEAYNASLTKSAAEYDRLQRRQRELARWDLLTVSSAVAALAALGSGTTIFFVADDPRRYDALPAAAPSALELRLLPAGLAVAGHF